MRPVPLDPVVITTDRLILRNWQPADCAPFAELNRDSRVMQFMPGVLYRAESDELAARISEHLARNGFGLYAAEHRSTRAFIGFIGLSIPRFTARFTPCVEIGWRLAHEYWRQGLATEGARAVAHHAFNDLRLPALVSFTVPGNLRSRRVMEKLCMTYDPVDDFDHPTLPEGHPLRRHVLYRLQAPAHASERE
jgi:RimJ/RimL family protein N-acetyltransferase